MIISRGTIDKLILSLDSPYEICCNLLEEKDNSLSVQKAFCTEGPRDGSRGSCRYTRYTKYVLHTHPTIHRAYPSAEDIIKVIKNKEILYSFIVTTWGIWTLYSKSKKSPHEDERKEWTKSLTKRIDKYDKVEPKGTRKSDISWTPAKQQLIRDISHEIEEKFKLFGLRIQFKSWEQIHRHGYFSITH